MLSFDPSKDDFTKNYKFLIGGILPRPIAVVSTRNDDGSNNLAPFSFFTGVSADPMIIAFCPLIRSSDGQKKIPFSILKERKNLSSIFAHMIFAKRLTSLLQSLIVTKMSLYRQD